MNKNCSNIFKRKLGKIYQYFSSSFPPQTGALLPGHGAAEEALEPGPRPGEHCNVPTLRARRYAALRQAVGQLFIVAFFHIIYYVEVIMVLDEQSM